MGLSGSNGVRVAAFIRSTSRDTSMALDATSKYCYGIHGIQGEIVGLSGGIRSDISLTSSLISI